MVGKQEQQRMITGEEAIALFDYSTLGEVYTARELYDTYRQNKETANDVTWDFFMLLSFVYCTGRVQGIREERCKKKIAESCTCKEMKA